LEKCVQVFSVSATSSDCCPVHQVPAHPVRRVSFPLMSRLNGLISSPWMSEVCWSCIRLNDSW
jgi:hypothetical protein